MKTATRPTQLPPVAESSGEHFSPLKMMQGYEHRCQWSSSKVMEGFGYSLLLLPLTPVLFLPCPYIPSGPGHFSSAVCFSSLGSLSPTPPLNYNHKELTKNICYFNAQNI